MVCTVLHIPRKLDQLNLLFKIPSWLLIPSKIKSRIPRRLGRCWPAQFSAVSPASSLLCLSGLQPHQGKGWACAPPYQQPHLSSILSGSLPWPLGQPRGPLLGPSQGSFPFLNLACILYSTFFFFKTLVFRAVLAKLSRRFRDFAHSLYPHTCTTSPTVSIPTRWCVWCNWWTCTGSLSSPRVIL